MKKFACFFILVLLFSVFLQCSYVGKVYFRPHPGEARQLIFKGPEYFLDSRAIDDHVFGKGSINPMGDRANSKISEDQLALPQAHFELEMKKGNLRIRLVRDDPEAMMKHHRYAQYYKDVEVFGGEIIEHIAYHVVLREKVGYSMSGIIDARTGEVLLRYSNINLDELSIGLGIGYHGDTYKLSTSFSNNRYLLWDDRTARPISQALQLRFLGTLTEIAAEKNSTIIFPLPLELLKAFTYTTSQEKK